MTRAQEKKLENLQDDKLTDSILENEALMRKIMGVIRDYTAVKIDCRPSWKDKCERAVAREIFNELVNMRDAEINW